MSHHAGLVEETDRRDEEERAILQTLDADYVWLPDAEKDIPLQLEEAVHSIKKLSRALAERGREVAKLGEEHDALAKQLSRKKAQVNFHSSSFAVVSFLLATFVSALSLNAHHCQRQCTPSTGPRT
jgi:chromosome segregation ATPase